MQVENAPTVTCDCIFCKEDRPFEMPAGLLDDFLAGKVALFAGAGISTENRKVLKSTFYEDIAAELGYDTCSARFLDLMEELCQLPNGRLKLLTRIKERLQHIRSFPELYRTATRFHKELATLYPLETIITTNWDNYFEEECAATPFVTDQDLAFWDSLGRKVLKIHGSIENYGSIIATRTDYKKCEQALSTGIIGSVLKLILATKTIVYVGYSFQDEDFLSISSFVLRQMKGLNKQAYIITVDRNNNAYYREHGLIPIFTDGTYFISEVKKHAESGEHFLPDSIYADAQLILDMVRLHHQRLHKKYNCYDNPEIVICASYQDGLIHAFERILALRNTGTYSHRCQILRAFKPYDDIRKRKLSAKRYEDVAYVDGYTSALMFILLSEEEKMEHPLPFYYAFGVQYDLINLQEYEKVVPNIRNLHKAAYKRA
jgi:hypothetical protein